MGWTQEQQAAIDARNDAVLVSAAAGSGKTAVLVERVLSLLKEGASIDRMLIVTFTRAAAAEMRERIEKALSLQDDPRLRRQAVRVNRASISTLHAFCQKFLKEHFSAAGIDPGFRLGTDGDLRPLQEAALQEALQSSSDAPTEDERVLFEQFDYEELEAMIPEVNRFLLSRMEPYAWAWEKAAQEPEVFFDTLKSASLRYLALAQEALDKMEALLQRAGAPLRYESAYESDRTLIASLLRDGFADSKVTFARLSTKSAPEDEDPKCTEAYKQLREQFKAVVNQAANVYPIQLERLTNAYRVSQPSLRALIGLCEKANQLFFEKKQQRVRLDFHDLEHLTLKALRNEKLRENAAGAYDHLFVDEYQDVSGIQESIVSLLHIPGKNHVFYVGDVKQSIYRFRSADPTLFMHKYDTFSDDPDAPCRRIRLNANFRSDKSILDFVNLVFRHAMRRDLTEIEYDEDAMLRPGPSAEDGEPVQLVLFQKPEAEPEPSDEEDDESGEPVGGWQKEAAFVAAEIKDLVRHMRTPDGKPIRYRDIVILLRNAAHRSADIAKVLEGEGIPVYSDADEQYFDLKEVRDMMTLCKVILNPMDDLTLLSALRCPCFGLTDEELALIRLRAGPKPAFHDAFTACAKGEDALSAKCASVIAVLSEWRFLSRNLPLDTFLWRLIEESGLYLQAGTEIEPEQARARLRLFTEEAQGENAQMTLADFVTLRENAIRAGDRTTARTLSDQDDVVRIMTLHKSKGLQFPVVFMMECCRKFRLKAEGPVRCDGELGIAARAISVDPRVELPNPAMSAVTERAAERQKSEEARLFYVGMTRARSRLYLLGAPRDFDKFLQGREATRAALVRTQCMMDWALDAIGNANLAGEGLKTVDGVPVLLRCPPLTGPAKAAEHALPRAPSMDLTPPAHPLPAEGRQKRPPLNTSVTALVRSMREAEDQEERPATKRTPLEMQPEMRPRFLMEETHLTGSERGTLLHRFLGLADLNLCLNGDPEGALKLLEEQGMFSPAELSVLRSSGSMRHLRRFYTSPLAERMAKSKEVHREWEFNLRLHSAQGEYLQGIIDLCFMEEGGWILCDYKTDRNSPEELKALYQPQQALYRLALERITARPVRECLLYSLHDDLVIPLDITQSK